MKLLPGLLLLLTGWTAHAQDAPSAKTGTRGTIVVSKVTHVVGHRQKPAAFYILQRTELNFKGLQPQRSFVPLILKSVDKDPF